MTNELAGARWWSVDFHTHTPASEDYGKGPQQAELRGHTPREWLLDFMHAGIDCVAVTDHNTGAWIDRLKGTYAELERERPEGFRPLHLFPGAEITANGGVHVLAILGPEKGTCDIDTLLGAVGIQGAARGSLEAVTEQSFVEVAGRIRAAGGLVIPAHVDGESGLFRRVQGATLKQVLACKDVLAAELFDSGFEKPAVCAQGNAAWSEVLGSDCHHPSGDDGQQYPGSHFTWIKMGHPSIEGLRLALLDGTPLSILRSDRFGGDPNEHARLVIEDIEIREARYAGRGPVPLRVRFSPWMSALIGGRGTGKSTVIEMLRLGLRRDKELPPDLQGEFDRFASVPVSRRDRGALTDSTRVAVLLQKDGARFRVHWRQDGGGPVIEEQNQDGEWVRSPGEVRDRFPLQIFSQKQVFALADDPGALLRMIDDAREVDRPAWTARWRELEARFLSLRSQARELGVRLDERARIEGELADVQRQLAVFEDGGHRDVLLSYQRFRRQRRLLDDRDGELQEAADKVRGVARELEPSDIRTEDFDPGDTAESEVLEFLRDAAGTQREFGERLTALADELASFRESWRDRLDGLAWAAREQELDRRYRALVERLEQEGVEDPTAYGSLVQRRHALEGRLSELATLEKKKQDLEKQAERKLNELEALRLELSEKRSAFLKETLEGNEFVRIAVVPFGEDGAVAEAEFRERIARQDDRLRDDILSADGTAGILAELYRSRFSNMNAKPRWRDGSGPSRPT